jgi:hypothetical protein
LDGRACSRKTGYVDFNGVHYDTAKDFSCHDALTGTEVMEVRDFSITHEPEQRHRRSSRPRGRRAAPPAARAAPPASSRPFRSLIRHHNHVLPQDFGQEAKDRLPNVGQVLKKSGMDYPDGISVH